MIAAATAIVTPVVTPISVVVAAAAVTLVEPIDGVGDAAAQGQGGGKRQQGDGLHDVLLKKGHLRPRLAPGYVGQGRVHGSVAGRLLTAPALIGNATGSPRPRRRAAKKRSLRSRACQWVGGSNVGGSVWMVGWWRGLRLGLASCNASAT